MQDTLLPTGQKRIWLCGNPRFLRESLRYELERTFGSKYKCEMFNAEPPELTMPEHIQWLIWFVSQNRTSSALNEFCPSDKLNVVFIAQTGNALVRQADGTEIQHFDISLQDLVKILQMPIPEQS